MFRDFNAVLNSVKILNQIIVSSLNTFSLMFEIAYICYFKIANILTPFETAYILSFSENIINMLFY